MTDQTILDSFKDGVARFTASVPVAGKYDPIGVMASNEHEIQQLDYSHVLDFAAEVNILGHSQALIQSGLTQQLAVGAYVGRYTNALTRIQAEYPVALAAEIADTTQYTKDVQVLPMTSSRDAIDLAIRMVQGKPRSTIITVGKARVSPLVDSINLSTVEHLEKAFSKAQGLTIGAIVVRPISDSGVVVPDDVLIEIDAIGRKTGTGVIYDETLTGYGRTGSFLHQSSRPVLSPDLTVLGGPGGGGIPFAAVVGEPGKFFHHDIEVDLFDAHPMAMSGGIGVLSSLSDSSYQNATERGEQILRETKQLGLKHEWIKGISGRGVLLGLHFDDTARAYQFAKACREMKLLVNQSEQDFRTVRLLPPVSISEQEVSRACDIMFEVCEQMEKRRL